MSAKEPAPIVGWLRRSPLKCVTLALLPAMLLLATGTTLSYLGRVQAYLGRVQAGQRIGATSEPGFRTAPESVPHWMLALPHAPSRSVEQAPTGVLALGLGTILLSVLVALLGVYRVARREELLTWTTEGLSLVMPGRREELAWDDVERVIWDASRQQVRLELRSGEESTLPWPTKPEESAELAKHMETVRRKASWGLLPEQQRRRREPAP